MCFFSISDYFIPYTITKRMSNFTLPPPYQSLLIHFQQQNRTNTTITTTKSCLPAQDKIMSLSHETRIFFAFCFAIFMIGGVAINSTAVYVAWITKQLKVRSITLMWYLCIIDSFGAVITNGAYFTYMVLYNHVSCSGKLVMNALAQFFSFASAYMVCYIGIDRYVRVTYLNKYDEKFTKSKFVISMLIYITLVVIQTTISIYCPIVYGEGYGALMNAPINIIICMAVLICYGISLHKLHEHNKKRKHVITSSDRSLITMASFHLFLLICCYGPSVLYSILYGVWSFSEELIGISTGILFMLNCLHGILNAFVFLFVNRKNRKRFERILKKFRLISSRVDVVDIDKAETNPNLPNNTKSSSEVTCDVDSGGNVSSSNESKSTVVPEIEINSCGGVRKVTFNVLGVSTES